jgi:hypothetical protein
VVFLARRPSIKDPSPGLQIARASRGHSQMSYPGDDTKREALTLHYTRFRRPGGDKPPPQLFDRRAPFDRSMRFSPQLSIARRYWLRSRGLPCWLDFPVMSISYSTTYGRRHISRGCGDRSLLEAGCDQNELLRPHPGPKATSYFANLSSGTLYRYLCV